MPRTSRRGRGAVSASTVRTRRFGFFARIRLRVVRDVVDDDDLEEARRERGRRPPRRAFRCKATTPPNPATGSDAHAASKASAIAGAVAAPAGMRCFTIVRAFAPTTRDV